MKFDSYHPAINLIYFVTVITATIRFQHPIFLIISFCCAFAYSVKLNGKRGLVFNVVLLPLVVIFAAYYSGYHHFGVTSLAVNMIGNQITLESIVYGLVLGLTAASVLMWFSCIHAVVSSDKIIYLFGRISPRLSLFLSILLRMIPHMKARALKINTAQKAIGRGISQGNILQRLQNVLRILSILVGWTMEHLVETSDSMKCRGYTLRGRTAFSIYRFDYRDRSFVITLFSCITVLLMGVLLDQTTILYNPQIILNRITPLSGIFYAAYACICLLPMALQCFGEWKFQRDNGKIKNRNDFAN